MKSIHWIFVLAIGLGLGVGITWWVMKPPKIRNGVTAVVPNHIYRSGQLDPADLQRQIEQRGIKTVVNLGSTKDWDAAVCQAKGVAYLRIPVGDVWQMESLPNPEAGGKTFPKPDLSKVWQAINDPAAGPVLIHCWGGTHRTGLFIAQYRIEKQGWSAQDAIDEMKLFGFDTEDPKFAGVLDYLRQLPQSADLPSTRPAVAGTNAQ
jgi:protein tyrosine phosphatase (PTP) superfamily phosphohydrolase (DUF442 family)